MPKSEEVLSKLVDEVNVLCCLKRKDPIVKIPDYKLVYEKERIIGVKYTFIEGKSLTEYGSKNLNKNPENAKRIGDFLTKLHSINLSELQDTNIREIHNQNYWENLFVSTKRDVFSYLNNDLKNEITDFFTSFISNYPYLSYKRCIIHGDLTASNIIYNKLEECIAGVIDFTDSQIGDPAFDFAGLYWTYGPKFTEEVLKWYNTSESKELMLSRVSNFYGLHLVFHELQYNIKNGKDINWGATIGKFFKLRNSI